MIRVSQFVRAGMWPSSFEMRSSRTLNERRFGFPSDGVPNADESIDRAGFGVGVTGTKGRRACPIHRLSRSWQILDLGSESDRATRRARSQPLRHLTPIARITQRRRHCVAARREDGENASSRSTHSSPRYPA